MIIRMIVFDAWVARRGWYRIHDANRKRLPRCCVVLALRLSRLGMFERGRLARRGRRFRCWQH
jgi:hypothetical protein